MFNLRRSVFFLARLHLCGMTTKKYFKSFVFFDLETTGLQRPVEITELCMIGVHREQLLSSFNSTTTRHVPRLLDKLTVCVRPVQDIEPGAEVMTNLSVEELENHKGFDADLAKSILAFILRQPQPCCLVAHGGDRYDFEILVSEFAQVGLEFPPSVQVSDSCCAFRELHAFLRLENHDGKRGRNPLEAILGPTSRKRISHTLGNLYKRYTEKDMERSHTAEGDSLALLELVIAKPEILEYIEKRAHKMGAGTQNIGLNSMRRAHKTKEDEGQAKSEASEVLEEYFKLLEQEGLLANSVPNKKDL